MRIFVILWLTEAPHSALDRGGRMVWGLLPRIYLSYFYDDMKSENILKCETKKHAIKKLLHFKHIFCILSIEIKIHPNSILVSSLYSIEAHDQRPGILLMFG